MPKNFLTLIKDQRAELLEQDEQKMLNEKMMMDPVISMILFNEYIPLRQRQNDNSNSDGNNSNRESEKLNKEFDGLFLGNQSVNLSKSCIDSNSESNDFKMTASNASSNDFITKTASNASPSNPVTGLFIRSQYNESDRKESIANSGSSGLFLKSEATETDGANVADDWIIA